MIKYHNINGQIVPVDKATLPIADLGITRGYGVFDFFRIIEGKVMFKEHYLQRFQRSMNHLGLDIGLTLEEIGQMMEELIDANESHNASMRLQATGGISADGFTPQKAHFFMQMLPFPDPRLDWRANGIKLLKVEYQRDLPQAKTTNYLRSIKEIPTMNAINAQAILYHINGELRESERANFFLVTADNKLVTPSAHILEGITRKMILEISPDIIETEVRTVLVEEIKTAKEAFISLSTKGLVPVVAIDDQQIGDGKPGSITNQLIDAFDALIQEEIKE